MSEEACLQSVSIVYFCSLISGFIYITILPLQFPELKGFKNKMSHLLNEPEFKQDIPSALGLGHELTVNTLTVNITFISTFT